MESDVCESCESINDDAEYALPNSVSGSLLLVLLLEVVVVVFVVTVVAVFSSSSSRGCSAVRAVYTEVGIDEDVDKLPVPVPTPLL